MTTGLVMPPVVYRNCDRTMAAARSPSLFSPRVGRNWPAHLTWWPRLRQSALVIGFVL